MVMSRTTLATALLALLPLTACATGGYSHGQLDTFRASVRTVALLPFQFGAAAPDSVAEPVRDALRQRTWQALDEARGRFTTTFQPLALTDSLLASAGVSAESVSRRTHTELARVLGVDAVIRGAITEFVDPAGGARVVAFMLGDGDSGDSRMRCTFTLFDARTGALLWQLDSKASTLFRGGIFTIEWSGSEVAAHYPFRR
jgi:hypothetical protein